MTNVKHAYLEALNVKDSAEPPYKVFSRRSQLEIRMDVLRAVKEEAQGPTQIMYRANLSWVTLCEHLKALEDREFLQATRSGNRCRYELTKKGIEVLTSYTKIVNDLHSSYLDKRPIAITNNQVLG